MNTLNITATENNITGTTITSAQPKHKWLARGSKLAKKAALLATAAGVMMNTCAAHAFAATGAVNTSSFITTSCTVLQSVICLIGGGVGVWGIVNLLEGYGNDNPGAKPQ